MAQNIDGPPKAQNTLIILNQDKCSKGMTNKTFQILRSVSELKKNQQSRQVVLRAYCPNIYTVPPALLVY